VAAVVSINGIDEAIKNLDYKAKDSPKLRLIRAIRAHYPDELALTTLQAIDPDTLVSGVWDTAPDENRLRSRRKNLASIRSSVNLDLKVLFENGKNPDGIIIGPSNTFVMSDEAKDQMLTSVAASLRKEGPVSLGQITRTLSAIEDLLAHSERFSRDGDDDPESGIRRLKHLIKQISKRIDLDPSDGPTQGETPGTSGPPLYPNERQGSDPAHGEPGDGGTEHANSESGLGNSERPGINGVTPGGIEGAAESSDGSGGNRVGAALVGAGVTGAGPAVEGSEAESGALASEVVEEDDPIVEEVSDEEEALDEVEIIDEPENLEVVDNPSAEAPGDSTGGDELETAYGTPQGLAGDEGPGVPGAGLGGDGSGAESPGSGSLVAGEGDLIPEELPSEQEDLDEGVEVIDEPGDLEVVDESSAEALGGSADGDEAGSDDDGARLQAHAKGFGQSQDNEKGSGEEPGSGSAGSTGEMSSLAEGGSVGDRTGIEGTESGPGGDRIGAESSGFGGEEMSGAREVGDAYGEAATEPVQNADLLPQEEAVASEADLEEVEEAIVEDGTPCEKDIFAAGVSAGGSGTGTMPEEEGGGNQAAATHETSEHSDLPVSAERDQPYLGNAGSQTATTGRDEGDPPGMDAQGDVEELDLDEVIEDEDDSDVEALEVARQAGSGDGEGFESGTGSGATTEPGGRDGGMDRAAPEMGLPLGSLGLDPFEDAYQTHGAQAADHKILAETFDGYLGAMERFYNQYILIPKGAYTVGGGPLPQGFAERRVRLPEFYMGKFPITNALFEIFVEKTGYRTTAEKEGYGVVYYARRKKEVDEKTGRARLVWSSALVSQRVDGACWYRPLGPGSTLHRKRNHPVVQVSLEDATAFAAWTGKRLPSEAEWEAASRSRNGQLYPWGDGWVDDRCNVEETQVGDTTPVDAHMEAAGPFGIADTLGNVMEWTLDRDQIGENGDGPCYIVKGGSWASASDICLCSRFKMAPDARSNILGFRCVAF
jgi:formylglycine-generating enzyme required for sulfatase activity